MNGWPPLLWTQLGGESGATELLPSVRADEVDARSLGADASGASIGGKMARTIRVPPGSTVAFRMRIRKTSGAYAQIADVSTASWTVTEDVEGATPASGSFVVADTVFDTLQTSGWWMRDPQGFNFAGYLDQFPAPDTVYRVRIEWTLADGNDGVEPFTVITDKE